MLPLWTHQLAALAKTQGLPGAMLAMEMGTGKSAVAVAYLDQRNIDLALIICPKSVAQVWPKQFAMFSDRDWRVECLASGTVAARDKRLREVLAYPRTGTIPHDEGKPLVVVVNYDVLTYAIGETIMRTKWQALILDEQHRIKQASGRQSRFCSRLADRVPNRLGLTGTPMPHSPLDIYAQYRALDKAVFGTSNTAFKARYSVMGGYQNRQVLRFQYLDDLHERMYRIAYRCRAEDVLDLPPFVDTERYTTLCPATRKAYNELEQELVLELENGTVTADNALTKYIRLAQISSGYVRDTDGKDHPLSTERADLLAEVLEEIGHDYDGRQEPVVVFARFHHDLDAIKSVALAAGLTAGELSGRRNDLPAWDRGEVDLLAVQLQAGGVGIDLTRARYCVYHSHEFSLGNYEQSRARVHRPGQTRPVVYIHLVVEGTIDGIIRKALVSKANVVQYVCDELLRKGS